MNDKNYSTKQVDNTNFDISNIGNGITNNKNKIKDMQSIDPNSARTGSDIALVTNHNTANKDTIS